MQYHRPSKSSRAEESEGFWFRLLAALIAVPIFELALFMGLYAVTGSRRVGYLFLSVPAWAHLVYLSVAVGTGLLFGFAGLTWLMGHLFYTHWEPQRNARTTALLWAMMFAGMGLVYLACRPVVPH